MPVTDTIFAPATLKGQAGLAVVRLSGPKACDVAEALAGGLPEPRYMALRTLKDSRDGFVIDEGLVVYFEAGSSFTGEDVVEFQVHGSQAVVDALCSALASADMCRHAKEGEFTERAFRNGRMDLTQVEGLSDLIAAETREQHRLANRVLTGAIGDAVSEWRERLVGTLSTLEATIDFSDEELPDGLLEHAQKELRDLEQSLAQELKGYAAARRLRTGMEVAIVGKPNVGKSTLLNRLAGREAAITSEIEGTTRDIVEVQMNIAGRSVTFLDTAGLRDATDAIEKIGVARSRERAEAADIRVFLVSDLADVSDLGVGCTEDDLIVFSKSDLRARGAGVSLSGKTGEGMEAFFELLERRVVALSSNATLLSHERHQSMVSNAVAHIQKAMTALGSGLQDVEFCAEDVRSAVVALDSLVGRIDVEEVLGRIFSRFCIGK